MGLMTAMLAMSVASMAINTYGKIKEGNAAKKAGALQQEAAESAAQLQEYNAGVADVQAKDAIARGQEEEQRFRTLVSGTIGTQRAEFAASNIDVSFGSAVDVQADSAYLGELDALTIRTNAAREAWGYQVEAYDHRQRAGITRKEGAYALEAGKVAQTSSRYEAAGNILNTGASLVQMKYGFGNVKSKPKINVPVLIQGSNY